MKRFLGFFLTVLLLAWPAVSVANTLPEPPEGPVLTLTATVSNDEARALGRQLGRYAPEEYKVLFLDTIGDEGPKVYADRLFEAWQLTPRTALLVVAIEDRWVQIRVGDELMERGVDTPFLNSIVDNHFAPLARQGDYVGAVEAVTEQIHRQAEAGPGATGGNPGGPAPGTGRQGAEPGTAVVWGFLVAMVAVALGVFWLVRRQHQAEQRRRLAELEPLNANLAERFVDLSLDLDLARQGTGETAAAFTQLERSYLELSKRYQELAETFRDAKGNRLRRRTLSQLGQELRQLTADLDGFATELTAFGRYPDAAREQLAAVADALREAEGAISQASERLGFALPLGEAVAAAKRTLEQGQRQLEGADPLGAKGQAAQAQQQVKALHEQLTGFEAASTRLGEAAEALAAAEREARLSLEKGYALAGDPLAALEAPRQRLAAAQETLRTEGLTAFAQALERFEHALSQGRELWRPFLEGDRLSATFAAKASREAAELKRSASDLRERLSPLMRRFKGWQAADAPDDLLGAALALEAATSSVAEARGRGAYPEALRLIEAAWAKVRAARDLGAQLEAELKEAHAWGERLSQELPRLRQSVASLDGQLGRASGGLGSEARQAIDRAGQAIGRLAASFEQPPADLSALPTLFATAQSELQKAEAAMAKLRAEQQRLAEELRRAEQRYGNSPEARRLLRRARGGLDMWDFILVSQLLQQAQRAHRHHHRHHHHWPTGPFGGSGGGGRGGGGGWGRGNSGGGSWGGGGGRGNSGGGGW